MVLGSSALLLVARRLACDRAALFSVWVEGSRMVHSASDPPSPGRQEAYRLKMQPLAARVLEHLIAAHKGRDVLLIKLRDGKILRYNLQASIAPRSTSTALVPQGPSRRFEDTVVELIALAAESQGVKVVSLSQVALTFEDLELVEVEIALKACRQTPRRRRSNSPGGSRSAARRISRDRA
jgi:hypothetical protein